MSEPALHKQAQTDGSKIAALDLPELYQCVHCGLCLNQCPTYRALRLETESPRGRIHLVKAAADGRIELTERFKDHLYLCLLCRACESACPSGVQYGHIAETAREILGPPGSKLARAVLNFVLTRLLPYPQRLRWAAAFLRFYQRSGLPRVLRPLLPERLQRMESMLPPISQHFFSPDADPLPAIGARRAKVAMLNGCVMPLFFSEVNAATVRVLRRNGCDVVFPRNQICCGALNVHNGESEVAKKMARRNIDVFLDAGVDAIIVNAAGCGAAMKEYDHLLRDDPAYAEKAKRFSTLVKDATEFLAGLGLVGKLAPLKISATYQDPCHLAHGQRAQPAAGFAESYSRTATEGNGRVGSLLWQRRHLQHHPSRHVTASFKGENAIRGCNSSRSRYRAQSRLHPSTPLRIATIWTRAESLSPHGSPRSCL